MKIVKFTYLKYILVSSFFLFYLKGSAQNQDDQINNLAHPEWYAPVPIGSYGDIVKIGHGKEHIVLVTGLGFDHSVFTNFMMRNKETYTMHAFTEAGVGSTIAPEFPKGQNYEERVWSNAFENAVIKYLELNDLKNVTVLGFFSGASMLYILPIKQNQE